MERKLADLFEFISKHREFNHKLQESDYKSTLLWHDESDQVQKVMSMLYDVANTQSQPKIDNLSKFYRFMRENEECLTSFKSFVLLLNPNMSPNYKSLFVGLKNQDGWGPKTSALFAKSIYHIHNGLYDDRLKVWNDAPTQLNSDDQFYLPVDSVIIKIFEHLERRDKNQKWTFNRINKCISEHYTSEDIEKWDDLWFWGFITQKTLVIDKETKKRVFEWNSNKYWALQHSYKSSSTVIEVKKL